MASDSERPIEKLLRRFAATRAREADTRSDSSELHPATRAMLQGEVTRQYRPGRGHSVSSFAGLRRFWPRLGFAAGILLLVSVGVAMVLVAERNRAKNAVPVLLTKAEDQMPAPTTAAMSQDKDVLSAGITNNPVLAGPTPLVASVPATQDTSGAAVLVASAPDAPAVNAPGIVPLQPSASTSVSFIRQPGATRGPPNPSGGTVMRFVHAAQTGTGVPPSRPLDEFQLQQSVRQIRIVDFDNSIYEGALETPAGTSTALARAQRTGGSGSSPKRDSEALSVAKQSAPTAYSFRVIGTNLSLNQRVVFKGRLLLPNAGARGSVAVVPSAMTNARWITGSVQVGNSVEQQVEAVSK